MAGTPRITPDSFLIGRQSRLVLTFALALAAAGVASWRTMPKQEDPSFPERFGSVVVVFPGSDPATVESEIVVPLEDALSDVPPIAATRSLARADVAIVSVELEETIYATDEAWAEVQAAVESARSKFPIGAHEPSVSWDLSLESVTIALYGATWQARERAGDALRTRLRAVPAVTRVVLTPDHSAEAVVTLDPATATSIPGGALGLAASLDARTSTHPGGAVGDGAATIPLNPSGRIGSLQQLRDTPVPLLDGRTAPLQEVASVQLVPAHRGAEVVRYEGADALIVGVVPAGGIDIIEFGKRIRAVAEGAEFRHTLDQIDDRLQLALMTFQPGRVDDRLGELQSSLLQGMLIVAAIIILAMGLRLGLSVALTVPIVALAALALFSLAGGVLHQISIAALVMSLGLLVDNAIVMSERIQFRVDRGLTPAVAARDSARELTLPLAAATGTTLAAFLPLLLSRGITADFTRALPQVVMLTVAISFLFALTVTPAVGMLLYRPRAKGRPRRSRRATAVVASGRWLSALPIRHPIVVVVAAVLLVALSVPLFLQLEQHFFPATDRNQVVMDIHLPEGTRLEQTAQAALTLERQLRPRTDVTSVATFVGRSVPPFYYNLLVSERAPHTAQLLATTTTKEAVPALMKEVRSFAASALPDVVFLARAIEQGPPLAAPVAVRVYHESAASLREVVATVRTELASTAGTRDVRTTLPPTVSTYQVALDTRSATAMGVGQADVAAALLARTRGVAGGSLTAAGGRTPIVVRSGPPNPSLEELGAVAVWSAEGRQQRLDGLATFAADDSPAAILRDRGRRVATVLAELQPGIGYAEVLAEVEPRLATIVAEAGASYELGGAAEGAGQANAAILSAAYIGAAVLVFILLAQFRSFRRVLIVLVTVPLASVGVVPGLLLMNQPFGFVALLGVIALIGIVVNNAIIFIDLIEQKNRRRGMPLDTATRHALRERLRPILLTAITTMAGLSPLLYGDTTLWPPFASAMISGLAASTLLTLLVVPAVYWLVFGRADARRRSEEPTVYLAASR